jgi:hypothetical protein
MSDPRIQSTCSSITDPTQRDSCETFATSCVEQSASSPSSYSLETQSKSIGVDDLRMCFMMSKRLAKFYKPKSSGTSPAPKKKPVPKKPAPKKAPPAGVKTRTPRPEYGKCTAAGAVSSPAHETCMDYIDICLDESAPYSLPTAKKDIKVEKQSTCLLLAPRIASLGHSSTATKAGGGTLPAGTTTVVKFAPDGKSKFANGFADVGFSPEVSDQTITSSFRMGFTYDGNPKGKKVRIEYTCKKGAGNSYTIRYKMFLSDDTLIGSESEITFETSGSQIIDDLAFGIELHREGNFSSIKSLTIVKL